jgi:predicted RNase H-like nuclease (RuvC/YqgF family)
MVNPGEEEHSSQLTESELQAILEESERQKQDDFLESMEGQVKGIKALEEANQLLEDQLEDANTEIDRLRRELERAAVEAEEADYRRREAEKARKQLESTLYQIQEDAGARVQVTDLRDARMYRKPGVLGVDQVTRGPFLKGLAIGVLAGGGLVALALEILSLVNGRGELFSRLF